MKRLEQQLAWTTSAVCAGKSELFYTERSTLATARAKALCRVCPVQQQCLEYALTNSENIGIWGGMTANERRNYKRRQRKLMRMTEQQASL